MQRFATKETWRVAALYAALTLVLAYPLTRHPASAVLSDAPDTNLTMWILAWDTHAFIHQPWSIFDANIYFPERRTLAYSESLIGDALFAAPVIWLTGNLVLALNTVVLLSVVFCGLGTYLLGRSVGLGPTRRVHRRPRLRVLAAALSQVGPAAPGGDPMAALRPGVPPSLFQRRGRPRDLRLFAAFLTLQALASGHGFAFLVLAGAIVVLFRFALGEPVALVTRARDFGVVGVLAPAPIGLLAIPYRAVQTEMGLRRSLENWTVTPESFLASPSHIHERLLSLFQLAHVNAAADVYLFPGFLVLLLSLAAIAPRLVSPFWLDASVAGSLAAAVYATAIGAFRLKAAGGATILSVRQPWRAWAVVAVLAAVRVVLVRRIPFDPRGRLARWRELRRRDPVTLYAVIAVVSIWMTIGPPLSLWLYVYWLPGLNFIRVPSRFILLAILAMAILAGSGLEWLTRRLQGRGKNRAAIVCAALLIAEFAAMPLGIDTKSVEIPAIDRWLATAPGVAAIAEVPLEPARNLGAAERRHTTYMLHSTAHWLKTVEGYSGIRPRLHEELYQALTDFPDERGLDALVGLGVTHVVVHTDLIDSEQRPTLDGRLQQFAPRLRLEHADDAGGRVYSIHPP